MARPAASSPAAPTTPAIELPVRGTAPDDGDCEAVADVLRDPVVS